MTGPDQFALLAELAPLRRDLVSDGFDAALDRIAEQFAISRTAFPSGSVHWGWPVPRKWSLRDGCLELPDGTAVLDLCDHPLRVGSYSEAVDTVVSREVLLEHVRVHPHLPDSLPFAFHYYHPEWSIGLTHAERDGLTAPHYRVLIDAAAEAGEMQVAEWVLPGEESTEFVFSAHLCHPGQASDGLSGVITGLAVMAALANRGERRHTYRLVFGPETIGSVAWLRANEQHLDRIVGGLFLEMTGLDQSGALQHSYTPTAWADGAVTAGFRAAERDGWEAPHRAIVANDERQFNGPGVRIPMLSFSRAIPRSRPEAPFTAYHSSADTVDLVTVGRLEQSVLTVLSMVDVLEHDAVPHNHFRGEPFLSGAGIAPHDPALVIPHRQRLMILDHLDGQSALSRIALETGQPFPALAKFVERLSTAGLVHLDPVDPFAS